jgi:hypothetical protein
LYALNLDADGNRVSEPRRYGYFLKTRTMAGRARIEWRSGDMPLGMRRAVREQLVSALVALDANIAAEMDCG